ncbi:hypothetical protein Ccrd_015600 [Cynara cardunculus var. scolymus]|uniref:Serine-rich protein-like protein n=1 Tax=Cynara cardunculus var. scolymus TaxID=59895 RepID=A0A103YBI1_CYNCS|nr:hypothetical protein Ccrd_015600 [Cynara cardunculus var. scolymus]
MMASSKAKSNIIREKIQRSISPSRSFCSSTISSSSSAFGSPMTRSLSPNRTSVDHHGYVSSSPSVCFSIDHRNASSTGHNSIASSSPRERSQTTNHRNSNKAWSNGQKKTCMCSPTTHPGSFRCSLHRNVSTRNGNQSNDAVSYHSHKLYSRRSAMTNSVVRIGTVEGDLVKRSLASLIRPSSHQQKRRGDFQPKPSRLSFMSKADE